MRKIVLASSGAIAISACGGGSVNSGGQANIPGNSLALEFAECMRAHGVPEFPDPGAAFVAGRCMRTHGVSGFPDPTPAPPSGASVIDEGGVFFVLPAGLALQAPAVRRAAHACGLVR